MEVLANTEYQDVYRIVDGVLLIVNKFKRIIYDEDKYFKVFSSKAKLKSYNKGCQKWLKVLKEDYYDTYSNITVPKGTVLYQDYPIELSNVYKYEVKTTGTSFSGNYAAVKISLMIFVKLWMATNSKMLHVISIQRRINNNV